MHARRRTRRQQKRHTHTDTHEPSCLLSVRQARAFLLRLGSPAAQRLDAHQGSRACEQNSPQCIRACDARSSWDVKLRELARRLANILKARAVMVSVSGSIPGVKARYMPKSKTLGRQSGKPFLHGNLNSANILSKMCLYHYQHDGKESSIKPSGPAANARLFRVQHMCRFWRKLASPRRRQQILERNLPEKPESPQTLYRKS